MSTFLFLERELLGAIRTRSAILFSLAVLFLFVFLASFASFCLFPAAGPQAVGTMMENEVSADVSPQLSTAAIDDLYAALQERPDVLELRFRFREQPTSATTAGQFYLRTASPADAAALASALRSTEGITTVEVGTASQPTRRITLSAGTRIGLFCGLLVSAFASLLLARLAFHALLHAFRNEVRMLRLSGIANRTMVLPLVVLGVLMGALAGTLLFAGLYLFYTTTAGASSALPLSVGRLFGVAVISFLLGVLMGGLAGLFGASHLTSRQFEPLP